MKRYLDQSPKDLAAKELSQIEDRRGRGVDASSPMIRSSEWIIVAMTAWAEIL